jgi:hypothetical protein
MLFSLEVLRARKGDCLLLHYGDENNPRLIMIDGGPSSVYAPHLKPRIQAIRKARGLGKNDSLEVDLLMVSHVDDDHIKGILDMTKELITTQTSKKSLPVQVLGLWHNTFEDIINSTPDELTAAFSSNFGAASLGAELPADATLDSEEEEEVIVWNLKALASIKQGAQLRNDADKLGYSINPEFNGKLIFAAEGAQPVEVGEGLTFTVAGPMLPELKKLHKKHQAWLIELKNEGKSPADVLSAYVDKSVPNLSSIVVLAELGGKRILLTGDARGDKILKGLELVGLLEPGGGMHVHILKGPHHGSSNNVDKDFFERIKADHYVFSGDGEHGNPERETLEMLLEARGAEDYAVHLTYPVEEIDVERKKDWEKEQAKEKSKHKPMREDWSAKKHSLAALFEERPDFAAKVSIVQKDTPHLINLLDEVEF